MNAAYDGAVALLTAHSISYTIYEHASSHTVADAEERLPFPLERILKTIAFKVKAGGYILAAVRGLDRVDYRKLAAASGTKRADIVLLSPEEVTEVFDVEKRGYLRSSNQEERS